jgi:hypothetical protein
MAKAKRVHSTPPTNTSANTPHKSAEGLSRRLVLAVIGAATALPIAAAMPANAEQSSDPIFAAIETWRRADAACVTVDGDIPDELGDRLVVRQRP